MKVELISSDDMNMAKVVWALSRPKSGEVGVEESVARAKSIDNSIYGIDAPINDFPSVTLYIESSIIEREIVASITDVIMWAQSSRVTDPINFSVDCRFENTEESDLARAAMKTSINLGDAQDLYRLNLPVTSNCGYIIRVGIRTASKLVSFLRSFGSRSGFYPLADEISYILSTVCNSDYRRKYKKVNFLHSIKNYTPGISIAGDTISYSGIVPFSLRTHLVRHMMLSVSDDLHLIIASNKHKTMRIGDPVRITVSGEDGCWRDICRKRNCWLAQHSMWRDIISAVGHVNILPCDDGSCPFYKDNEARLAGEDPNPVCPKYCTENSITVPNATAIRVKNYIELDNRPGFFWSKYI